MNRLAEYRIGNWIQDMEGKKTTYHQIIEIRLTEIIVRIEPDRRLVLSDTSGHWSGIPLSPDILERLGFVKSGNAFTKGVLEGYMEIYVLDDVSVFMGDVLVPLPHVKYLHQLQNFYYSVMGQELTLSSEVEKK